MGWWRRRGLDCDDILSYDTVKVVTIRDRKLGILHYSFLAVICGYIVLQMVWNHGYLLTNSPHCSIRAYLRQPNISTPAEMLPYCMTNNTSSGDFSGVNILPCKYWGPNLNVYPETEQSAMLAATRVTQQYLSLNCSISDYDCRYHAHDTSTFYVADIERFTLTMDHQMYVDTKSQSNSQANAQDLTGKMLDSDGNHPFTDFQEGDEVGKAGYPDVVQIGTLIKAAGISSLDSISYQGHTRRYDGILLLVMIEYTNINTLTYTPNRLSYTITVHEVARTEFKSIQTVIHNTTSLMEINRHGIRMLFMQYGSIGTFDLRTLLLTGMSAIGLVKVATLIVDFVTFYFLKQKNYYKSLKYELADRPQGPTLFNSVNYDADQRMSSPNYFSMDEKL